MTKARLPISLFLAFAPFAAAASEFAVPRNSSREIDNWGAINEDCTPLGATVVTLQSPPRHGAVQIKFGHDHPTFPASNPRSACNAHAIASTQAWYRPAAGYVGPDSVTFDIVYPNGYSSQFTIAILVR